MHLKIINNHGNSIVYSVNPTDTDLEDYDDFIMDLTFEIWRHWGQAQESWTNCIVWYENTILGQIANWDDRKL